MEGCAASFFLAVSGPRAEGTAGTSPPNFRSWLPGFPRPKRACPRPCDVPPAQRFFLLDFFLATFLAAFFFATFLEPFFATFLGAALEAFFAAFLGAAFFFEALLTAFLA